MTATALPRGPAKPRISSIDHRSAMQFAATEYARGGELLARLEPAHWPLPTLNTGWDVRATVGHTVGMMEMVSSLPAMIRQQLTAKRGARRTGAPVRRSRSMS